MHKFKGQDQVQYCQTNNPNLFYKLIIKPEYFLK